SKQSVGSTIVNESLAKIRQLIVSEIQRSAEFISRDIQWNPRAFLVRIFKDDDLFEYFVNKTEFGKLAGDPRFDERQLAARFDLDVFRLPPGHSVTPQKVLNLDDLAGEVYQHYRKYRVHVIDAAVKAIVAIRKVRALGVAANTLSPVPAKRSGSALFPK